VIVLLSGGLDSTVLTAWALSRDNAGDPLGWPDAVAIDYGQRHRRELDAARKVAAHYRIRLDVLSLAPLRGELTGSALTDPGVTLPEGHYTDTSMAATVVPGRNLLFIAAAAAVATARGDREVAIACHAGDHPVYPDCRPGFLAAASAATLAGYGVAVRAPFADWTKDRIAAYGARLDAPLGLSWSCYAGGDVHCGRCGTCVERAESFALAGVPDPTEYADPSYWRQATAHA
jgi:7-cyano-7-deazaguanine synthase